MSLANGALRNARERDTRSAPTAPPPAIDPDKARWAKQLREWAGQMLAHANELEEKQ